MLFRKCRARAGRFQGERDLATFKHIFREASEAPDLPSPWESPQWGSHLDRYEDTLSHSPLADRVRTLARFARYGQRVPNSEERQVGKVGDGTLRSRGWAST